MANLKELRNRITSVRATQKITKAMQMVAAAKLRRAQEAALAARPYAERMDGVIANLNARVADKTSATPLLVGTGKSDVHLLIVATAERGLCGGFNSNISRLARRDINRLIAEGKTVKIMCVGRKGYDALRRSFEHLMVDRVDLRGIKQIAFSNAEDVADRVSTMFGAGEFDVCTLYFSLFKSVMEQIPTAFQLIPANLPDQDDDAPAADDDGSVYEYEPEEDEILSYLLNRNLSTQVFRALLENAASEQGARMTAMDSATRNAGDMIDSLTLTYNRSRQAQITKELIEIISGAEAL